MVGLQNSGGCSETAAAFVGLMPTLIRILLATMFCVVLVPCGAATPSADLLLARMEAADPGLETYTASVEFKVGLHSFPFLRRTLHGEAYFKRPSRMELVFNDLPPFARAFRNLYVGLGTPSEWEKKFTIDTAQATGPGGEDAPHLVLTPRASDHRLRHVDVYLDAQRALPSRIVWTYRDGTIELHQGFSDVDGHSVISDQHADIRLPGIHAYVVATIDRYAINVPVDDAVFTKR
jgi:hypothetical protein